MAPSAKFCKWPFGFATCGGAGNDILKGGSGRDRLFGEAGDDRLSGGLENDILVGGEGKDQLIDASDTNLLIGGNGSDKLTGGSGDDLLIAGRTDFDTDLTGLTNILNEWTSTTTSYADRVDHLKGSVGGLNGTTFLTTETVHNDGVKDVLKGGKGTDWFILSTLDTLDLKTGEQSLTV